MMDTHSNRLCAAQYLCMYQEKECMFVCLIWGLTSPSTLYRSFARRCFQFCGTFTRHWDEMTSQTLPPNETNRVYKHGRSDWHHFAWAGLDPLSGLPVLMSGRFQLCVEASCSPIYFFKPRWAGGGGGGGMRNKNVCSREQEKNRKHTPFCLF